MLTYGETKYSEAVLCLKYWNEWFMGSINGCGLGILKKMAYFFI